MTELIIGLLICLLALGGLLCIYRLIIGPTIAERAVAGDGLVSMVMGILILVSVLTRSSIYLTAVIVIALLGFINTLAVSRYLELTDSDD